MSARSGVNAPEGGGTPPDPVSEPSPTHVSSRYHVWRFDSRRRMAWMVTGKRLNRHDPVTVPAVWDTRSAADAYARGEWGRGAFMVRACEGDRCGMGDHGDQEAAGGVGGAARHP